MVKTTIDVNEELWRKFSALIASRGIYRRKSKVIEQLLRDYVERGVLELAPSEVGAIVKFEREMEAFLKLKEGFEKDPKYRRKFVAIADGKVVDSDADERRLVKRVYKKLGYTPVYIGFAGGEEVLEIPSPEVTA